ncbi:MAG TPA: hypothetical protein VHL80_20720 [Polyangia bacterium]|nr:hypothetical protein [Polyangia bacterium]
MTALDEPRSARISWGAVFGGAVSALGLWLLLYAFGVALGLSTVDPNNPHSLKGSGIFTGIWSVLSPLIALFVGGLVAGRLAGSFARGFGALHGLVMWGLVSVAGAFAVMAVVSSAVSGAAALGTAVAKGGGRAIEGMTKGVAGGTATLDIDWNAAVGPLNQRLTAEGKPTVTADQLRAATKDALESSMREGRFDRTVFENALAQNTALTQSDAQEVSQQVEAQINDLKGRVMDRAQVAADKARVGALKAADATGKAFWVVFGALVLGLCAAIAGGALGVPRLLRERIARGPRVTEPEPTPRGPILPPREAYPR